MLGDEIAKVVVDKFNTLNSNCKPTIRSNGVEEWTVLASIVALIDDEIVPITLTTGVKTLPDEVRKYSKGTFVHDCHAEILSLRLFNYYILKERNSNIVANGKLRDNVKLALFVSEPPCGDASMNHVLSNMDDTTIWQEKENTEMYRGRDNFGQLAVVRTKPGRADSRISLSKSCSDKLCLKQVTGVNSAITSQFFEPIYLTYLVSNLDQDDFDRCFNRLNGNLTLLKYQSNLYKYKKSHTKTPAMKCLVHLIPTNQTEILNNGVKNGATKKNAFKSKSMICNKSLMDILQQHKLIYHETYSDFKKSDTQRERLKKHSREILKNWVCTSEDNFQL